MTLTISNAGSGNDATGTTTLTITGVTAAVGDMLIVVLACDNAGTGGASAGPSCADSASNTYIGRSDEVWDSGVANAGAELAIFTSVLTTALSSGTVTLSFTSAPNSKAAVIYKAVAGSGGTATFRSAGTAYKGSTDLPTVTAIGVASGDTIIGGYALENATLAVHDDTDTTNGTWSTAYTDKGDTGANSTSMQVHAQYKTVTATGDQTFDPWIAAARDSALNYILVYETPPAAVSRSFVAII